MQPMAVSTLFQPPVNSLIIPGIWVSATAHSLESTARIMLTVPSDEDEQAKDGACPGHDPKINSSKVT